MSGMPGTALHEAMWVEKARTLAFFLLILLVAVSVGVLPRAEPAHADTTFFVNSTKDREDVRPGNGRCYTGVRIVHDDGGIEGECTLRAAIQEANAFAGADAINFGILSTEDANCDGTTDGVCTISPASQLPTISRPLTIRGYSQPGASVNTATTGTNAALKIVLDGSKILSSADGLVVTARNTTVRGLVINDFRRFGVFFDQETPTDAGRNLEGCFIGTDVSGTEEQGNGVGVLIDEGAGNVIGGTTLAAHNIISGNNSEGIVLNSPADGNTIQGNLIGTDKNGTDSSLGNFTGVRITGGSNNTIGGNGAGNTIAFNRVRGIQVQGVTEPNSGTGNTILSNSIFSNGTSPADLGIELGADGGVTPNDGDNPATPEPDPDSDTGANRLQNFPVITSATTTIFDDASIAGRLNSTPNRDFTIQLFSSSAADASGFGEGETFLGEISVTTNSNGNRSFSFITEAVSEGDFITATATRDATGDTSEFSKAERVQPPVIEQ